MFPSFRTGSAPSGPGGVCGWRFRGLHPRLFTSVPSGDVATALRPDETKLVRILNPQYCPTANRAGPKWFWLDQCRGKRMPSSFRIALGRASCRNGTRNQSFKAVCDGLMSQLEKLRGLPVEHLRELPKENQQGCVVGNASTTYTTYRMSLEDGRLLIVVQAFVRTLAWPTYISFAGVGRMYAEGFVVSQDGKTTVDAPDELLWEFR